MARAALGVFFASLLAVAAGQANGDEFTYTDSQFGTTFSWPAYLTQFFYPIAYGDFDSDTKQFELQVGGDQVSGIYVASIPADGVTTPQLKILGFRNVNNLTAEEFLQAWRDFPRRHQRLPTSLAHGDGWVEMRWDAGTSTFNKSLPI